MTVKIKEDIKHKTINEMKDNLGKTTQILYSFDTTGSMSPAIVQVRENLHNLITSMSDDIPNLQIAIISHGDYCDGQNCISVLDFTNDVNQILKFVKNTPNTGGGDLPECYELVLQKANSLSWGENGGSIVLIGDDQPHDINPTNIEWRKECEKLLSKNIKVFPMQCLYCQHRNVVNEFWEEVASINKTPLLKLESFGDTSNTLEAVAYITAGSGAYCNYMRKCSSETLAGVRSVDSVNLASNKVLLANFSHSL